MGPRHQLRRRRLGPVRELIAENAATWISEFHLDGLRIDTTHAIYDSSNRHILAELGDRARAAAPGRQILLIAENETQENRLVRRQKAGECELDTLWNDDFHHNA